jgi:hypothetical protein
MYDLERWAEQTRKQIESELGYIEAEDESSDDEDKDAEVDTDDEVDYDQS